MKILRLTAENIKRLRAVQITPDGNTVIIGGKNAQGKTSTLDSISYALEGRAGIPHQPIRKGAKKAKVVCELDDLTVTRTFTPTGGGSLTVANKEGVKYSSPQAMLDKLMGYLGFDPLAFTRADAPKQLAMLKRLVGLDFDKLDQERSRVYADRKIVNQTGVGLKAEFEGLPFYADAPEQGVSLEEKLKALEKEQAVNADNKAKREELAATEIQIAELKQDIEKAETEVERAIGVLREAQKKSEEQVKAMAALEQTSVKLGAVVSQLIDGNEEKARNEITKVEEVNKQVQANKLRVEKGVILAQKREESQGLTQKIEAIDTQKAEAMAAAKFPVGGLGFNELGVTFNNLPFNQASSAETLRVSVAMGLAMNPELKVLLIRDGSLLDKDNLKMIAEMAEEADAQIWIETVSEGEEVNVIIEDGMVKGAETE